jgi:hypothetical protein
MLSLVLALLATQRPSPPQAQLPDPVVLTAREIGTFTVSGELVGTKFVLRCTSKAGATLFETSFEAPPHPSYGLAFSVHSYPHLPDPLIVASVDSPGADGYWLETVLIAPVHGRLQSLFPNHLQVRGSEDGLCVTTQGQTGSSLAVWRRIVGTDAVISPHRYSVVIYRWSPSGLVAVSRKVSQKRHASWVGASEELSIPCIDLLANQLE